jgi:hypothetical protein
MILIGHPWIESPNFHKVFSINDIKTVSPKDIVLLEPLADSHTYAQYCYQNHIKYAVVVNNLEDALYANALHASYMVCEEDTALMIQPIAQEYLFDSKILVLIHSKKEISKLARNSIDGVIFSTAIIGQ